MVEAKKNVWITLNTKLIAKELRRICGTSYNPRLQSRYFEGKQHSRMSSSMQQANQEPRGTEQHNLFNQSSSRDQAYPPNWNKQQPFNITPAHFNAATNINFGPSHQRLPQSQPVQSIPQQLQLAYPAPPIQPWMSFANTNPYLWQHFNPSHLAQQHIPPVRLPPIPQNTMAFQRNGPSNM